MPTNVVHIHSTPLGWYCAGCRRTLGPLPGWWNPLRDGWLIDLAEETHRGCAADAR